MSKTVILLLASVGGTIGGYIPVLFGMSLLSFWSLLCSGIGAIAGIWIAVKINDYIDG